jgi:3'-5' exonuclease
MNTFLDIESIPAQPEEECKAEIAETIKAPTTMSKAETISQWHSGDGKYAGVKDAAIEAAYRSTSFDGAKGQICSVAYAVGDGDIRSISGSDERQIMEFLFSGISEDTGKRQPYFVGHYVAGFDLKFIFHRAVIIGIVPPFDLPFSGRHNQHYYDNMAAWAGFRDRISQANLAKALGISRIDGEGIGGDKVWDYYKEGRIAEIEAYNRADVDTSRQIYNRLNFIN